MSHTRPTLDLSVAITTPENIRFEYRIAGPFRRCGALLIDILIRYTVIFGLAMAFLFSGIFASMPRAFFSMGIGLIMVLLFLLTWFYGAVFETIFNGQTPGKRMMGLRVISIDGRPINGVQATVRNMIRVADTMPLVSLEALGAETPFYFIPTFVIGFFSMLVTQRMQRLGDLAAGTMVVVDERYWYPKHAKFEDPRIADLADYIPANFHMSRTMASTIALYIDRRGMLSVAGREEMAKILAQPLKALFRFREDTSNDLLLCAIYYRDFLASVQPIKAVEGARGPSPLLDMAIPAE